MAKGNAAFNFGDLSGYSAGGGLPEGDYIWKDLTVLMHQGTKQDGSTVGPPRLGVMITLSPLGGGEDRTQFYSLGSNADKSWAPNPETGKGLVPVPGGPGVQPNASTNWALLIKSLFDSGLPQGVLEDDLSVLEGMHVHMANIPEPEERKGFVSKTGEAAGDSRPKTVAVVTEIKEDGKPWEGTGGVPAEAPAKGKAAPAKPAASAKVAPKVAPKAAPVVEEDGTEEAARAGASSVLEKNEKGCAKLILKTGTFKAVKTAHGEEMAQKVTNEYFTSDDAINSLINPLGFTLKGAMVVPE